MQRIFYNLCKINLFKINKNRFLNDLEGEENSNPVKLVDSIHYQSQTANNFHHGNQNDTNKNKSKNKKIIFRE